MNLGFKNLCKSIKAHVTSPITNPTINTWTDFTGFTKIEEDSCGYAIELNTDTKTFVCRERGIYKFGGCVHVQNNTLGNITAKVLIRIYKNGNYESRCSQRGYKKTFNQDTEDVLSYSGIDFYEVGDTLTLQYYITNSDLDFDSADEFDNQVAASVYLNKIGDK